MYYLIKNTRSISKYIASECQSAMANIWSVNSLDLNSGKYIITFQFHWGNGSTSTDFSWVMTFYWIKWYEQNYFLASYISLYISKIGSQKELCYASEYLSIQPYANRHELQVQLAM